MKRFGCKSLLALVLVVSFIFSFAVFFISAAEEQTGYVTHNQVRVRTSPTTTAESDNLLYNNGKAVQLNSGDTFILLETVDGINDTTYTRWHHIKFSYDNKEFTGYIYAGFAHINSNAPVTMPSGVPDIYKPYIEQLLKAHPTWKFIIYDTGYDWSSLFNTTNNGQGYPGRSLVSSYYAASYRSTEPACFNYQQDKWVSFDAGGWYQANTQTIAYYMDPRNFLNEKYIFMFEQLSYNKDTQTLEGVQDILKGSFMDNVKIKNANNEDITYAQAYIDAGVYANVSPYHLASRTIQEVGKSGSNSTSGKKSGYEGYYNFYNIGATQGDDPIANGLSFAKTGGSMKQEKKDKCLIPWNTQYRAIKGGAYWISDGYINSKYNQSTLYYQKFNTSYSDSSGFWHQYMGNIMAPMHESKNVRSSYVDMGLLETGFTFIIPYYRNMPNDACQLPAANNCNPNNWLKSLTVDGLSFNFSSATTSGYNLTVPYSSSSVKINATPINSKAVISGAGTVSLKVGANKIPIVVTAENGNKRTYTLDITRKEDDKIHLTDISLSKTQLSMYVGDSQTLSVGYYPSNTTDDKSVTWSTSNPNVVTVSNGAVKAVGKGEAVITAKVGSFTKTCKINVTDEILLGDIDADRDVTIADALMIFKFKTGEISLSPLAQKAADTDKNGSVELADALMIFKYKSGEISSLNA